LSIIAEDGCVGRFDISPYLEYEAVEELLDHDEFLKVSNVGYFIEWDAVLICRQAPSKCDGGLLGNVL
jgi:stalled ribosome rescue protein Dom34